MELPCGEKQRTLTSTISYNALRRITYELWYIRNDQLRSDLQIHIHRHAMNYGKHREETGSRDSQKQYCKTAGKQIVLNFRKLRYNSINDGYYNINIRISCKKFVTTISVFQELVFHEVYRFCRFLLKLVLIKYFFRILCRCKRLNYYFIVMNWKLFANFEVSFSFISSDFIK